MVNTIPQATVNQESAGLEDCTLAAIDIGTNSIHMVVVRIQPTLPASTIIAREKETVRLGHRDLNTGNLTSKAIQRSLATLKRCQDLAVSFNADYIIAVATSAVREAPNGREFLAQIESELGLSVDLISGQEEARRIYLGVLSGMEFNHQPHIIIDIGGGSTELILADSYEPRFLRSTKVGAVRLTQEFITTDPINHDELNYLHAYVRGMLERSVDELRLALKPEEKPKMIGTSGTIETLATINALHKLKLVPNPLHGYEFSRRELKEMVKHFAALNCAARNMIPGMSERRAEIILPGAVVLLEAMTMLKLDKITICERALREGVIVDWMLTHGLIENRLRYQGEVRQRNVIKIAHKYQVDLAYSERIANFSLSIFDQTLGHLHHWGSEERELLWGAAILHNCGVYISHGSHHKHSYYLIRNAELLGFTEIELEIMANLARYHRKSTPKKRHEPYNNLSRKHKQIVSQLSAILRLAVALDRRQIGAIAQVKCEYYVDNKQLILHLVPSQADDDCALELWNLDYKKEIFEEEYQVKVIANLKSN